MAPRKKIAPPPEPEVVVEEAPAAAPAPVNEGPNWYTRILGPGSVGEDVKIVQGKIGTTLTGVFDTTTEVVLNGWLAARAMDQIGMVDLDVACAMGNAAAKSWWTRQIRFTPPFLMEGEDVAWVQQRLGIPVTHRYCNETVKRVKGWQSLHGLKPTGDIDQATAERFNAASV